MLFFRKSANGKKMFNKGKILENLGKDVRNLKIWKRASDCVSLLLHAINSYKRPSDCLKQKFKKYAQLCCEKLFFIQLLRPQSINCLVHISFDLKTGVSGWVEAKNVKNFLKKRNIPILPVGYLTCSAKQMLFQLPSKDILSEAALSFSLKNLFMQLYSKCMVKQPLQKNYFRKSCMSSKGGDCF